MLSIALEVAGIPLWGVGGRQAAVADEIAQVSLAPATPDRQITLRDRLIAGLRVRLTSEVEFIDRVVEAVDDGDLPPRLVNQVYFWARSRAKFSRDTRTYRPIIYFQIAMRMKAEKLGVQL